MSKVLAVLSNPQFRQWVYGLLLAAVPLLMGYGIIDANQAALWLSAAGSVLGLGTATITVAKQRASGVLPAKPADATQSGG